MAGSDCSGQRIEDSLRQHVLTPVSEAQSRVERELDEVDAERRAFGRFRDRVAGIEPVPPRPDNPARQTVAHDPDDRTVEQLRGAYRETVMSVAHYDDVFGESLDTNVAAELSAEVATGFQRGGTRFTTMYKSRLTAAVDRAIAEREAFCETLATERDSLESCQESLVELLDPLDGPRVPVWHTTDFQDALSDIAHHRQEIVHRGHTLSYIDDHDLYAYLYRDENWTYPVLTAIARLRGAVEFRTERSAIRAGAHE